MRQDAFVFVLPCNRTRPTVGVALFVLALVGGCTPPTSAQKDRPRLPLEEIEDDNYQAVKRKPANPGPGGTLLKAKLTRGSVRINQGELPTWVVTLEVANRTDSTVQLGESLVVIEKARGSDESVAVFVARERKPAADHLRRLAERYGLAWGVTVPADEPGVWPFGALTDGSRGSALGLFLAVMSAPRPKAYRGGGYPSLDPHQETSIREELLYPDSLKSRREAVFVVAPLVRPPGKPAIAHIFRFDTGDNIQAGQSLSPTETWMTTLVRDQLEKVVMDSAQPNWRRVFALNWLAETQFEATSAVFRNLASQGGVPRQLKFAAMLNLGIHQHKEGLPALVASLKENDPLTQAVAIAALGELGEAAAAAEVRPFLSSRNDLIAATSAEAAGMLRDGESVAVLLKFLADKDHEKRHPLIAKALSKIGTQPAWDGLLATAAGRQYGFQARRSAALSLGEARYGPATPVLTKVLNDDREDEGIRLNMISALALLGSEDAWAAITAVAGGKNQSLARSAVQEMGGSKNPAQIAQVIEIAGKAGHAQRETALDQIRYRKLAGAGPTLRAVIREASVSADLRAVAASALAATSEKLEDEDFSALWMAWERERDPYARERLADALIAGGFGDKTRIPELIDGLDEDKNQSWFANVKLLRHLTGQKLGPENKYSGDKKTRKAEFEKWRAWRAAQRP